MRVPYRNLCFLAVLILVSCSNNPHTKEELSTSTAIRAYSTELKYKDPVRSYYSYESKVIDQVYEYALHRPQEAMGAGSTLTMVLVRGMRAYVANVGDSRTYVLRNGNLTQLTRDHSVVAELVSAGRLTVDESFDHPQSGLITRCLGCLDEVEVDIELHRLESGDCLLLCSDGLWEMLRDPALMVGMIQAAPDLDTAVHRLVEAANHAGGHDNISVALLRIADRPDIPT